MTSEWQKTGRPRQLDALNKMPTLISLVRQTVSLCSCFCHFPSQFCYFVRQALVFMSKVLHAIVTRQQFQIYQHWDDETIINAPTPRLQLADLFPLGLFFDWKSYLHLPGAHKLSKGFHFLNSHTQKCLPVQQFISRRKSPSIAMEQQQLEGAEWAKEQN